MAPENFGYVPDVDRIEAYAESLPVKYGDDVAQLIATDDGRDAFLYRAVVYCLKKCKKSIQDAWLVKDGGLVRLRSYNQGNIGSCVGNAEAMDVSVEAALDILVSGEPEEFHYMASPEALYAIGREAGGMLGGGDGSYGSAMAEGEVEMGTLWQTKYGEYDLSTYSVSTCRAWGRSGIPRSLKPEAAKHKIESAYRIKTVDEAWALIGAGNPINQCSNLGFSSKRDSDGACRQTGSWAHSMAIIGRRTTASGRKLFLIINSWGDDWVSGPMFEDQPLGSFYVDYDNVARAIAQRDVFVKIGVNGIRNSKMEWDKW